MSKELLHTVEEVKNNAIYRIEENSRMLTIALQDIEEELVWKRPNGSSNSIGNQLLHLCGNITQYAIAALGGKEDIREREVEFSTIEGYSKKELLHKLEKVVSEAKEIIVNISIENLLKKREVQGFNFSGIGIIMHVVEHYSYHTGQIAFWVKQLKNKQLGFYDGMDLTIKNK